MADVAARAEQLKAEANVHFQAHHYNAAIEGYTKSLELLPTAIVFANRAFAHLKIEHYLTAIEDATQAIRLDPSYVKAYYRRGSAHLILNKTREARNDFREAVKLEPTNKETRSKLIETEKLIKKLERQSKFLEILSGGGGGSSAPMKELDPEKIAVPSSYTGPRLGDDGKVTLEFVTAMIEYFKDQKMIHRKYALQILLAVRRILAVAPTVTDIPIIEGGEVTVFGDVHGQFFDLVHIFSLNGMPSESNPCLFNGDFVDRGSFSVEVILTLFALKCLYPQHVHLNRGNHETVNMNKIYGFEGEVKAKLSEDMVPLFTDIFCWLPLAAVIDNAIFVVHGGLFSKDSTTLADVRAITRHREPPDEGIMTEMLWSDPQPENGRAPSKRGVGVAFGPDVTKRFLRDNDLKMIVRSHECKDEGYEVEADGMLVTVFSAPNYCDQMGNKGAFIRFDKTHKPKYTTYSAVPHPQVRAMQYANPFGGMNPLQLFNLM